MPGTRYTAQVAGWRGRQRVAAVGLPRTIRKRTTFQVRAHAADTCRAILSVCSALLPGAWYTWQTRFGHVACSFLCDIVSALTMWYERGPVCSALADNSLLLSAVCSLLSAVCSLLSAVCSLLLCSLLLCSLLLCSLLLCSLLSSQPLLLA
eukprot:COSAG06_NODE_24034_length_674_cov_2.845217_1_plen_151_part_10